jgi:hypothetical protein
LSALRGVWLLTMMGLGLMAGSARAEDFEAGKSGATIFEADCATCHRSPRGLTKGMNSRALVDFLREHYTTGLGPANELAAYLQSTAADNDDRRAPRAISEEPVPRGGDQRSQESLPADTDAGQRPPSVRKHRRAGSTREPDGGADREPPPAHVGKRRHAHPEPTIDTQPAAAPAGAPPEGGSPAAEAPQPVVDARESRHKHRRTPKGGEPTQMSKRPPEASPASLGTQPRGGATEPSPHDAQSLKEGVSPAAPAAESDHPSRPPGPVQADHQAPPAAATDADATSALPHPPMGVHAPGADGSTEHAPPHAAASSSDQPAFSAPSP